jgi:hypothetical protein
MSVKKWTDWRLLVFRFTADAVFTSLKLVLDVDRARSAKAALLFHDKRALTTEAEQARVSTDERWTAGADAARNV